MHQATRVRFHGGDPLALTKRIQARRYRLRTPLGHECPPDRRTTEGQPPPEPIVTSWKEALSILWQAGLLIVLFVGIAVTGPIFAAAMGMGR